MSALDDLGAILQAIDDARRTLLVSPELEEPVTELVKESWLSGFVTVKTSPHLPEGKVYLVDERALRADLDRPVRIEIEPTQVRIDRAVVAAARSDAIEHVRRKAARAIAELAHQFAVEVHQDDVSAVEVEDRDDEHRLLFNMQWRPGWRADLVEVELRGGYHDGETVAMRPDQVAHGLRVHVPMAGPLFVAANDPGPPELPMPEHYELAGWREVERRWVLACS